MADIFDQVATPTPQQSAPVQSNGDVFDQVGQAQPDQAQQQQPPEQPGFLSRAYETSPLPGMLDAAKQTFQHSMDAPVQGEQTFHNMVDSLKNGNFREAAGHAAQLLVGDANPFIDAAKSVISGITKDAHQSGRDMAAQIPGASAVTNYVKDVRAGNTPAALGDVVGGVSSVAPMLLGDEASVAKGKAAARAVADTAADVAGKAKALVSEDAAATKAQPAVQGAIRDAAEQQSNVIRAREGSGPEPSASIRDSVKDVGDSIMARSKAAFSQLDEASGGRWQRFSDTIENLRDKANEVAGIDDDQYDKLTQKASDVEQAQSDLIDKLVADGKIEPEMADGAKADYKQSQALYDVSQQVRNSASGLRPELGSGTPEMVDPAKLSPRLNKLYDSGRLQQALGEDGAAKLVQQVDEALRTKSSAIKTAKLVKTIGKVTGAAVGLGALGHGAASILGGGH